MEGKAADEALPEEEEEEEEEVEGDLRVEGHLDLGQLAELAEVAALLQRLLLGDRRRQVDDVHQVALQHTQLLLLQSAVLGLLDWTPLQRLVALVSAAALLGGEGGVEGVGVEETVGVRVRLTAGGAAAGERRAVGGGGGQRGREGGGRQRRAGRGGRGGGGRGGGVGCVVCGVYVVEVVPAPEADLVAALAGREFPVRGVERLHAEGAGVVLLLVVAQLTGEDGGGAAAAGGGGGETVIILDVSVRVVVAVAVVVRRVDLVRVRHGGGGKERWKTRGEGE